MVLDRAWMDRTVTAMVTRGTTTTVYPRENSKTVNQLLQRRHGLPRCSSMRVAGRTSTGAPLCGLRAPVMHFGWLWIFT